jgi:hypothetical protein
VAEKTGRHFILSKLEKLSDQIINTETMVEKIIGWTSSYSNVYKVVDNNNKFYKNMIMDAMKMNWDYACQYPIVDEKADATKFFDLLKNSD